MRKKILFLITFILIFSGSLHSTTHEHFTYFFDSSDLSANARSSLDEMSIDRLGLVKKGQIESQALGANPALWTDRTGVSQLAKMEQLINQGLSYKEASIRAAGIDVYGEVQKRLDDYAKLNNGKMPTYKWYNQAISEATGQSLEDVHRLNFSMDMKSMSSIEKVRSAAADEIRLNSYMSSDKIRKKLLLNLLEDGKKNEALAIFRNSLNRVPLQNRGRIAFGLPNEFVHVSFEGHTYHAPEFLKELREVAKQNGSSWEFLTSFVRNQLEGANTLQGTQYNLDLDETIKGMKEGYLDGIDFAGSIAEENAATTNAEKALNKLKLDFAKNHSTAQEKVILDAAKDAFNRHNTDIHNLSRDEYKAIQAQKKEYYVLIDNIIQREAAKKTPAVQAFHEAASKLKNQIQIGIDWHAKVLEEVSKNGGVVRFHALEGAWEGVFYDEHFFGNFERILEKAKTNPALLPNELFIGHSAGLDKKTNQRLYDLFERLKAAKPDMKLIVEMNVTSNASLQSKLSTQGKTIPQALAETVEELHRRGIHVAIGADGLGKMGEAATLETQLETLKNAGLKPGNVEKLRMDSIKIPGRVKLRCQDLLHQMFLEYAHP